ncbi:MAG: hypothetical protein HOI53_04760, partial [Francisellaceae bacterium]|nr:hypothetical protein [Francisellaceae bacterium]
MSNKPLTIVISGFAGMLIAEPGGAIANALRKIFKNDIRIIALAYTPWANAAYAQNLVDEIHIIRPLGDPSDHFNELQRVFNLCNPDIYIPALELEVRYARQFYKHFKKHGPKMLLPDIEQYDQVSKLGLHYFCNNFNFLYPNTIVATDTHQLTYNLRHFNFPCLIKSTLCGAILVHNDEEAQKAAYQLSSGWTRPALIQSYIEGEQFMVAALYDDNNDVIQTLSTKKHLVDSHGKSAITVSISNPSLNLVANKILSNIHWSGPLELEFIRTAEGQFFLFEINPRFPSWIDIGSNISNNLPAILVNHLQGKSLTKNEKNRANHGEVLLRDTDEACVALDTFDTLSRTGSIKSFNVIENPCKTNSTKKYTIAITGASSFGITMPGLSIAKFLKSSDHDINLIYLAECYQDTGCYRNDLFSNIYNVDFSSNEKLLKSISNITKEQDIDAIIPTLDRHIQPFCSIQDELSILGINMCLPDLECVKSVYIFPCNISENKNINTPRTQVVKDKLDVNEITDKFGNSVVLKTLGASKACVRIAHTPSDIHNLSSLVSTTKDQSYVLQQYIKGEHFAVCGLAKSGKIIESLAIKTMQSCSYGKIWMATKIEKSIAKPFLDTLEHIVHEFSWDGPIEIDCIRDTID